MSEFGAASDLHPPADIPDEVDVQRVNLLVQVFLKALKAYRLYLPNNQVLRGFVESFHESLMEFLVEHGELCLRITQHQVRFQGVPVYESRVKEESLAFRLFINGIREFTFHEGVPIEEVADFLQSIDRAFDTKTNIDDILTLLWEKDLEYITFIILDDFFEEGEQAEFEEFRDTGGKADQTASSVKATVKPLVDRLLKRAHPDDQSGEFAPLPDIFRLEEEELAMIEEAVAAEGDRDTITDLSLMLTDLLRSGGGDDDAREVLIIVDHLLEALLDDGRIPEAAKVISELKNFQEEAPNSSYSRAVSNALSRLNGDLIIRSVRPHLATAAGEREFLVDFLASLGEEATKALLDLLDDQDTREVVTEILRRCGQRHFGLLLSRVGDPRPRVAASLLRVIGELGDPRALGSLRGPLHSDETLIRRETIRAIETIGTAAAFPLIKEVLADPEQDIRVLAIRALAALPSGIAHDPIMKIARAKEFPKRSYFEKKEVLLALGQLPELDVEAFLVSVLKKRRWFHREEYDELRACAVLALARRGTARSDSEIRAREKDRSPQVRRAVAQAIRKLDSSETQVS